MNFNFLNKCFPAVLNAAKVHLLCAEHLPNYLTQYAQSTCGSAPSLCCHVATAINLKAASCVVDLAIFANLIKS